VVTAWEVLEHIPEAATPGLFNNIRSALKPGAVWHVTVKPWAWCHHRVQQAGVELVGTLFKTADFPRGAGNKRTDDWNA